MSDTSLTGRDLLTTDELINFKFGEALFLIARFNPIKSNLKQIKDYPIKYKVVDNITINQDKFYRLEIFDLDTFRIEKELFDLPEEQPKASPTGKKKKNASKQSKS